MQKLYIIFIIIGTMCSCSKYKGEKDFLNYDKIEIVFKGYGDYATKGKIYIPVLNKEEIGKINCLKNKSKVNWFANLKPTEYFMRIIFTDSKTNKKLMISITKGIERKPTIEYGSGTIFDGKYKNDKLIEYLDSLIDLNAIKAYNGVVTQQEYDEIKKCRFNAGE